MKFWAKKNWAYLIGMRGTALPKVTGMVLGILVAGFVAASLLDIFISVLKSRFYTEVAFVVTFVVVGIITASVAYINLSEIQAYKSAATHDTILATLIISGLVFFFPLAKIEGGEYEVAFKGYGAAIAATSFLFFRWDKTEKQKTP